MHAPTEAVEVAETRIDAAQFDFEAVFRTDYDRIARAIGRVIQDPARAEDLAVEAFWRLWRTPRAQGASAGAWLHRTAIRLALDELRRHARRARYESVTTYLRPPRTPDDLFSTAQEQGRVRVVLAAMPRREAELLLLRSDDYSYDDLAKALAINAVSVGTFLSRAKEAFRKEYVKRYGEP
jgi:RNA polymerase sigma-70 factor (ECF subfamily)